MNRRNAIWLAVIVAVGLIVGVAVGWPWGVAAGAVALVIHELVERARRRRRRSA